MHRFRSQWLELSRRLRNFRARYGLTQDEVAAVVGANDGTALAQWENGTNAASAAQAPPRPMASWLAGSHRTEPDVVYALSNQGGTASPPIWA